MRCRIVIVLYDITLLLLIGVKQQTVRNYSRCRSSQIIAIATYIHVYKNNLSYERYEVHQI